jgi:hydrogenase maturation factor HypF (carbamoyltransferase family)
MARTPGDDPISLKAAIHSSMLNDAVDKKKFRMFVIPCSCGNSFAVAEDYDRRGMHIRSFIPCPKCGKRHDPRNRLLTLDYQDERFWKVGGC